MFSHFLLDNPDLICYESASWRNPDCTLWQMVERQAEAGPHLLGHC
jgi:hypothetical protein